MHTQMKKLQTKIFIGIIGLLVLFGVYQAILLHKAHSTLSNYEAFRGCTTILSQTDTSATCINKSGQTIQIVKINNKWYLQGDGPGVW
jgi:hypothetical protein